MSESTRRDRVLDYIQNEIPFCRTFKLSVVKCEPDEVSVSLPNDPLLANGHGQLHGGAISALIDSAAGALVLADPRREPGKMPSTASMTVNYLRVPQGAVTATARPSKHGARVSFVAVEVVDASAQLVAQGLVTIAWT
jgi:1,4-dihydroxy-2-naphthoyl-CoA hydrolase